MLPYRTFREQNHLFSRIRCVNIISSLQTIISFFFQGHGDDQGKHLHRRFRRRGRQVRGRIPLPGPSGLVAPGSLRSPCLAVLARLFAPAAAASRLPAADWGARGRGSLNTRDRRQRVAVFRLGICSGSDILVRIRIRILLVLSSVTLKTATKNDFFCFFTF